MNEWFKKSTETIKTKWGKWTVLQKVIAGGIILAVVVAIVLMARMSSRPTAVKLFSAPVNDEQERSAILTRLDEDSRTHAYVSSDNYIYVENEAIAKKYRSQLIAEGLAPSRMDSFALFDVTRWSRTQFDNQVNWKRSMESLVKSHLESLDGIMRAEVVLTLPEESLFSSNQNPTTASVILFSRGGSNILEDKKQIKGIQNLIMRGVEGLKAENISIVDGATGQEINDFEGMAESDRLSNIEKEKRIILKLETEYASRVLKALQVTFGDKRVQIANMKIDMNTSKRTTTSKQILPTVLREDNPNTPYDDSEIVEKIVVSEETINKSFTGTGYNPEGPAGVEGQNPPVYSDMSNVIGKSEEVAAKKNYAFGEKNVSEDTSPQIDRVTISVNIDGRWELEYSEKNLPILERGHLRRKYTPVSEEELKNAVALVQGAVGYTKARGDNVVVTNIPFDRSEEHNAEDMAFIAKLQRNRTIMFSLVGIAVILIAFIAFRIISREIEKRRRLAEEARIREQEEARQRALMEAQQQGMEVTMSVEERKRAELQENAIAMAKEHPEDVAMLIRTWLMEE
ncbi:flagellar basal-body MS-ring/collar protein FliF [Treponema sp.]|uniref:flagellar basal-body MS-ring/collar protein FliF n=1 Tax=Treponema sp. TaxID=166 RepID=UPI001D522002|nr:flagellar basal-body MS-ring/collar protein FliF [Treponema sp.]MBS7240957.1 flagellar M-ring protein FliF [Treponema sp.]MCI6442233.1 flagellar M-ring protein FliF [Spirochaetia bacterium]MDY4132428.1 flagellar basal-body MS-ring/collar protein FliF [Treponema sp.]